MTAANGHYMWQNMTGVSVSHMGNIAGLPVSVSHMVEYDKGHLSVCHLWENMTGSPVSVSHMGECDR